MSIRKKIITSSLYLLTLLSFYKISYSAEAPKGAPLGEDTKKENTKEGDPKGGDPKNENNASLKFMDEPCEKQDKKAIEKENENPTAKDTKTIEDLKNKIEAELENDIKKETEKLSKIEKNDDKNTDITNIEENVKIVDTQNEIQKKSYC